MKKSQQDGTAEEVYGRITVMPSEGTGDAQQRTVILSGLTSASIQAAAEYFASPHHLLEFQNRLKAEYVTTIPAPDNSLSKPRRTRGCRSAFNTKRIACCSRSRLIFFTMQQR